MTKMSPSDPPSKPAPTTNPFRRLSEALHALAEARDLVSAELARGADEVLVGAADMEQRARARVGDAFGVAIAGLSHDDPTRAKLRQQRVIVAFVNADALRALARAWSPVHLRRALAGGTWCGADENADGGSVLAEAPPSCPACVAASRPKGGA